MTEPITPEWVKHAVFYQIFPDRFASSSKVTKPSSLDAWGAPPTLHGYQGGDLIGVTERLDYLADLGINAIYFTPIFQSASNHRYHTHDYFQVDPILGGNAAFKILLDEAHRRKIRVVIDGVFNHASRGFYQFNHALENGKDSPYLDWFHFHGFPVHAYEGKANYDCWWGIPALPKFNTDTPAVREFIFSVAEYWIREGADGWRLDVPAEINDDSFWCEFRSRVKAVNQDAYIVGEIWHEAHRWLKGNQFDAVMNYVFTKACMGFFARDRHEAVLVEGTGLAPVSYLNAKSFATEIVRMTNLYHSNITHVQMNLLDSHDTARFLQFAKSDVSALKLATLFQMTYSGAPSIYYGDEIGMLGRKDPDSRRAFIWDKNTWDAGLHAWVKECIALRHTHPALRTGSFEVLYAEGEVIAFKRHLNNETLIVIINAGRHSANLALNLAEPDGTVYRGVFGTTLTFTLTNQRLQKNIPARSGVVLLTVT
jgi:neopullulanase